MEPFWQKAILQAIGPLVAAVLGTLVIGLFAASITRRAQQRQANNRLREQLASQMTGVATALYLQTQRYWRARRKSETEELRHLRVDLDDQYNRTRVAGEVLESRLRRLFGAGTPGAANIPQRLWHGVMDLLTVRYFDLIGEANDNLRRINAGPEHTGLSADELKDAAAVLRAYRARLIEVTDAVLREPMVSMSAPVMAHGADLVTAHPTFESPAAEAQSAETS